MLSHKQQRLQHLTGKATDERGGETVEVVRFDQLIKVDAQQLHRNTQVTTEVEVFSHLDDMVLLLSVLSTRQQEGRSCA